MEIRSYDSLMKAIREYKETANPQRPMMVCFGPEDSRLSNENLDKFKNELRKDISNQFDISEVTEPAQGVGMIVLHRYFLQMDESALRSCVAAVADYGKPVLYLVNYYDYKLDAATDFNVVYYCISEDFFAAAPEEESSDVEEWLVDSLQKTFDEMRFRIHFKPNPKYDPDPLGVYYIGYSDMSGFKYVIRKKTGEEYNDEEDPVIVQYYGGIRKVLADGWMAD